MMLKRFHDIECAARNKLKMQPDFSLELEIKCALHARKLTQALSASIFAGCGLAVYIAHRRLD